MNITLTGSIGGGDITIDVFNTTEIGHLQQKILNHLELKTKLPESVTILCNSSILDNHLLRHSTLLDYFESIGKDNLPTLSYVINLTSKKQAQVLLQNLQTQKPECLEGSTEDVKSDKSIVLEFVKLNGLELKHATQALRSDQEVVKAAVKENWGAFEFASEALKGDREFVLKIVKHAGKALKFALEPLQDDAELVKAAVIHDGNALQFASVLRKGDLVIVKAAVSRYGKALRHASLACQDDSAIVLKAVANNGKALQFASVRLQGDLVIVRAAVQQSGKALQYASEECRANHEIALTAANNCAKAYTHVPTKARSEELADAARATYRRAIDGNFLKTQHGSCRSRLFSIGNGEKIEQIDKLIDKFEKRLS